MAGVFDICVCEGERSAQPLPLTPMISAPGCKELSWHIMRLILLWNEVRIGLFDDSLIKSVINSSYIMVTLCSKFVNSRVQASSIVRSVMYMSASMCVCTSFVHATLQTDIPVFFLCAKGKVPVHEELGSALAH